MLENIIGRDMNYIIWLSFSSCLVFIMQGGFLALESGLTRSKNNINVALKNVMDLSLSLCCFWIFGYALAFKTPLFDFNFSSFKEALFFSDLSSFQSSFFVFQALFCSTCSTIVSGAVAERLKFRAYPIIVIFTSILVYPVIANSIWSGVIIDGNIGWLYEKGFYDHAGSTVIHSVGGWMALGIIIVLGPRLGKFSKDGKERIIPGNNLPISALGCIALWFGWLGFNSGGLFNTPEAISHVILNTLLSGSFAIVTAYFIIFFRRKEKPQFEFLIFSSLSGLVGITASCTIVTPSSAVAIGIISAIICNLAQRLIIKFEIDDVTGAVTVHLAAGIWGTLAVGIFGDLNLIDNGLSRFEQILVQLQGIAFTALWVLPISLLLAVALRKFNLLRVNKEDEIRGLNISEHNELSEFNELLNYMKDPELNINKREKASVAEPYTEMGVIAMAFNRVIENLHSKEQELEEANQKLLERNKELKNYNHTVAHDLKNPLGVIRSFSDILLSKEEDEKKKKILMRIKNACNTSLDIIDGLLEIAKSDVNTQGDAIDLNFELNESIKMLENLVIQKDVQIRFDLEIEYFMGNKIAIKQIITNLISNAIKYGPVGKQPLIRISTKKIKDTIQLEFEDNGIGIKPEDYENIFQKLSRVENKDANIEGHGIGLSTVKNLVEKYQGTIEVSSIEHVGSIFTIYLPYKRVSSEEKQSFIKPSKKEKTIINDQFRVLVVDDDSSMLDILAIYLKKYYSQIVFATNGIEAIETIKSSKKFDVILIDQSMPEMDGLETINAIRNWEQTENKKPSSIVALTAASDKNIIIDLFDAGCDTYIEKPFNKNTVISTVKEIEKKATKKRPNIL